MSAEMEEGAMQSQFDVAVVGAGVSGLVCAQALRQQGHSVVVLEKSRGLGGRLATRRLPHAFADHGVRCLQVQGNLSQQLIQTLAARAVIQPWVTAIEEWSPFGISAGLDIQHYGSPNGITAAAKFLSTGLEIYRGQRVQSVAFGSTWELMLEAASGERMPNVRAKALVVAIPAPQALLLLEPLANIGAGLPTDRLPPGDFWAKLRSPTFNACITAIATYPSSLALPAWKALTASQDAEIAWISFDQSKSPGAIDPVLVVQSNAAFAEQHREAEDLSAIGQHLLSRVKELIPQLPSPDLLQVHRWRYAFARNPLAEPYLTAAPLPLVCAGDWCGGRQIESALQSGLAAAAAIAHQLGTSMADSEDSFSELIFSKLLNGIN
ncbi:MAG: NAD(P)-binding protein [Leptolyngbyaceae cyanobacterium CSU_1_4]|nr:NAD(P)-binding protein [Leptolyngbyaceae cyanobacterium CSU_1_4]